MNYNFCINDFEGPLDLLLHLVKESKMDIYEITRSTIPYLGIYQPSPCDGKERKPKYKIPNKMKEFLRIYERT